MGWLSGRRAGGARVIERYNPDVSAGLTLEQVSRRREEGLVNAREDGLTPSTTRIVLKNTLTLFNIIIVFLAAVIIMVGHPANALFIGVAVCNTAMGIVQELRAKKTLDKLSVLAQSRVHVVREGKTVQIPQEELVTDDIVFLAAGDQVCADCVVELSESMEADESLLTGESERIRKEAGQELLSGSFITGGRGWARVTAVGSGNYASTLSAEAKKRRKNRSRLLRLLGIIIRVLTVIIIPLGLLLYYANINRGESVPDAVLGSAAAVVGMIPSGLVLLTGVTLTVGALNLARRKALVQSLPGIETLARVDVLCLDKTGTITDGSLVFERMELQPGAGREWAEFAVSELMGALRDSNATAKALTARFGSTATWRVTAACAFTSDRKWSGATFDEVGSYVIGAPGIVLEGTGSPAIPQADRLAMQGYRVLCLAYAESPIVGESLPVGLCCSALLLLSDTIRADAAETFRYFAQEDMAIKVISGDNPRTVSAVAAKAGLAGADEAIDMSAVGEGADLSVIAEEYTVFGYVKPRQKQELVRALRANKHVVCMTGDGVNDILAMRESDCGVAMVGGSGAARSAGDFVLMASGFGAMVNVLREGRRVINNIERVASLYLVNTIYSVFLSIIYTFLQYPFPYTPLQMTPVNALTTGIPSFFLALRASYDRPAGKLFSNIFEHAFPAAVAIVFNTLYMQFAAVAFELPYQEMSAMIVFLSGVVGFFLLLRIAPPFTKMVKLMTGLLVAAFLALFIFFGEIFSLGGLISRGAFLALPLVYISYHVQGFLGAGCRRILDELEKLRERGLR